MAVRGLKVDDKELQRFVDNLTAREMTKVANAGVKAMEDISKNTIDSFYKSTGSSHSYSSLMYSLKVKKNPPRQDKHYAWVDIDMEIDESAFLYATEDFYSIYGWADRHDKSHPWAAGFVVGLQWNSGIVGLPSPYAHLSTSTLSGLMQDELQRIWSRRVNKYL